MLCTTVQVMLKKKKKYIFKGVGHLTALENEKPNKFAEKKFTHFKVTPLFKM